MPSIVDLARHCARFRLLDDFIKDHRPSWSPTAPDEHGRVASGLGAHLTWTLPFGLLVIFAVSIVSTIASRRRRATRARRHGRRCVFSFCRSS